VGFTPGFTCFGNGLLRRFCLGDLLAVLLLLRRQVGVDLALKVAPADGEEHSLRDVRDGDRSGVRGGGRGRGGLRGRVGLRVRWRWG